MADDVDNDLKKIMADIFADEPQKNDTEKNLNQETQNDNKENQTEKLEAEKQTPITPSAGDKVTLQRPMSGASAFDKSGKKLRPGLVPTPHAKASSGSMRPAAGTGGLRPQPASASTAAATGSARPAAAPVLPASVPPARNGNSNAVLLILLLALNLLLLLFAIVSLVRVNSLRQDFRQLQNSHGGS